ncbi:hypothetical protein F4818DRAFT_442175 [Hypoxylon cercidicola]|nr:hypothetical protein F4818DRAFT_442175 [Hypoxylon cercidicola]
MDYVGGSNASGNLPYPNLIQKFAHQNQHAFFKEPVGERSASTLIRTEKDVLDELVEQHCPTFGSLSPAYEQILGGKKPQQLTFFRENRGTADHGLGRDDEDNYECAKYNILRHPRPEDYNNPDYIRAPGPVTGLNAAYLKLANYPKIAGAVMSAPLLPTRGPGSQLPGHFQISKAQQPSALTRVFEMPELCEKLMVEVGHRWGDLSNLSRTCQTVMFAINKVSTRVDLTTGNFLNLEFTDEEIAKETAKATEEQRKRGDIPVYVSASFVIVSNIRGQYKEAQDGEGDSNEYGYPAFPKGTYDRPCAAARLLDISRLLKSIHNRGSQMKILHLHTVPNLDIVVLMKCLRELPNLEVLGVHNCELLHFGTTVRFLKAIIRHNKKPGYKRVRSDFSPYYYTGPNRLYKAYKGEFGVVPSDHGVVDTRRAMAAILYEAIPLALNHDIDWFTPGTGMRHFLDRIPFALGTVRYILEAIYNLYDFETGVTCPKYYFPLFGEVRFAMQRTLYNDLILAVNGKPMDSGSLKAMTTRGPDFHLVRCSTCNAELPSYFFTTMSMTRQASQIECCGCQLRKMLEGQVDNFFQEKKRALEMIFDDKNARFKSMEEFLHSTRVASDAEIADPQFGFWALSVMTRKEFRESDASGGSPGALVLDGRPGPDHPSDVKKIYIWKEQTSKAMDYAYEHIEDARNKVNDTIAECHRRIQVLDYEYHAGIDYSWEITENRDTVDKLERYIDQTLAQSDLGQMAGKHGTRVAPSWEVEIERYRQLVQAQVGVLQNHGPYNTVGDSAPTGFW